MLFLRRGVSLKVRRIRRLAYFLKPYRAAFALSLGAASVASLLDGFSFALIIPFLRALFNNEAALHELPTGVEQIIGVVTGGLLASSDSAVVLRNTVLLVFAIITVKNLAVFAASYSGAYIEEGVAKDLRVKMYDRLFGFGLGYFERTRSGQLLSRMLADAEQTKTVVSHALTGVLRNGMLIVVYMSILFSLSWRLAIPILLLAPMIALAVTPLLRKMRSRLRAALNDRGELTAVMNETVIGARLVKAHGTEKYERSRFRRACEQYFSGIVGAQRLATMTSPLSETLAAGVLVGLLLGTGWVTQADLTIRPEIVVAFVAVTIRLLPAVKSVSQFPAHAIHALSAAERIFEVIDREPDDVDAESAAVFPGLAREIELRDVWFGYGSGRWVLRGVNLTIEKGQIVAVVGRSGCGKSTLVDMVPRFLEPQRGTVMIDGTAISAYSRASLRKTMGIVSQEAVVFNDTVRANIAYGAPDADLDSVVAAARAANAHQFITKLPLGYDTTLGERGADLSGGERQRIAIARALFRDPPILILDEATSSLDAESERLVQEAISRLLHNRTVLVVAHRLSTVQRADLIAVLEDGKVVEYGKHADLIDQAGAYQRLYSLATEAGEI